MENTAGILKTGIVVVSIGAGAYFGKKQYDKWRDRQATNDVVDGDANADLALRFKSAVDTGITKWLSTNDSQILDLVQQAVSVDWKKVVVAYKKLTAGGNLLEDLRRAMRDSNYQIVLNMIGINTGTKKATSEQVKVATEKPSYLWSMSTVNIRKNPVVYGVPRNVENNIIKTVPPGKVIGISTEKNITKKFYDPKSNTFFLEVYLINVTGDKKPFVGYVAASQVKASPAKDNKNLITVANWEYVMAKNALAGIGTINELLY